jgi:hypothetical protein
VGWGGVGLKSAKRRVGWGGGVPYSLTLAPRPHPRRSLHDNNLNGTLPNSLQALVAVQFV